jgi:hypothetical protein
MSGPIPIELPPSTLEVLADLTVRLATLRPEADPVAIWAGLLEATWPTLNAPLISITAAPQVGQPIFYSTSGNSD